MLPWEALGRATQLKEQIPQSGESLSEEEKAGEQIKQVAPAAGFSSPLGDEEQMRSAPPQD